MSIRHFAIPAVLLFAAGAVPAAFLLSDPNTPAQQSRVPIYGVKVISKFKHDPKAFSQGLVIDDGALIEGTGQRGESQLRKVELRTGKVQNFVKLPSTIFGEGVTVFNDKIYQLTWERGLCYVYDRRTMVYQKYHRYTGEGWGLTHNGKQLIMSDGSNVIRFIGPANFTAQRTIRVTRDNGIPVKDLNELEFINGLIYANIWHSDYIARIDPATGRVKSWLDLSPLKPNSVRGVEEAVLNGIAWDAKAKKLYVTGKDWPTLFEIEINKTPKGRNRRR